MSNSNSHPESRALDWRRRGQQDAVDGRFDPPADPDDRAAYESGYHASPEITP